MTCEQRIEVVDPEAPMITCTMQGGDVDQDCEYLMPFAATLTDNCGIDAAAVAVNLEVLTGNARLGIPTVTSTQVGDNVSVSGTVLVSALTSCPAVVRLTVSAVDRCNNPATPCTADAEVFDRIQPVLTCPPDITLERGDKICNTEVEDWLHAAAATDNCDPDVDIVDDSASNGFACGFPYGSSTQVTWTATDDCGNGSQCSATITIEGPPRVQNITKGSVLIFPHVELRWSPDGQVLQDTFLELTNDYPGEVFVHLHFVNGDPALPANYTPGERAHPGWNWVNRTIRLTANEPTYWSVLTGLPKAVSPFVVLDPGQPPGRPDPAGSGDRVLRGFVSAWASDASGAEIRWNHLTGNACIADYSRGTAWEYKAWAFASRCLGQGLPPLDCTDFDANGTCCAAQVIPGNLDLDAFQFDRVFDLLLLDFYAAGAILPGPQALTVQPGLGLLPAGIDLRANGQGPVTTKARFDIWNMNETKFSGTERCVTFWDQAMLASYAAPNHFLRTNLQTDRGKARLDGRTGDACPGSIDAALLGLAMTTISFPAGSDWAVTSGELGGSGTQSATIRADVTSGPPEMPTGPAPAVSAGAGLVEETTMPVNE